MMKPFNRISSLKKITCFFMHLINCKRDRCVYVDIEKDDDVDVSDGEKQIFRRKEKETIGYNRFLLPLCHEETNMRCIERETKERREIQANNLFFIFFSCFLLDHTHTCTRCWYCRYFIFIFIIGDSIRSSSARSKRGDKIYMSFYEQDIHRKWLRLFWWN